MFDLARLTDFDFEAVCKDLFEEILGVQLELFAPGADQGIDLRHLGAGTTVVQCKHWINSGRSALIRNLRTEAAKVRCLRPDRYVLATSVDLTPSAKERIKDVLSPQAMRSGDIYGIREIESELRKRSHIVRRHMRLWLSSASVLDALLSKEIVARSAALKADLEETLQTYVPNASYNRANELLDRSHVCVIAGVPGVGKTTLAQVLAAAYAEAGFEVTEISEDAEEANRVWDDGLPQLFYYDDFLGQTTLEDKLHKNEDGRLLSLLRRTSKAPNKRFVLTTREYILAQARSRYERLASHDFDALTCVLDLSDYTPLIRAEILYNHIYFSDLSAEQNAIFSDPGAYQPVVRHPNFNPRPVSASLNAFIVAAQPPAEVPTILLANLSNPRRLWEHIVNEQLDEADVHLLLCLLTLKGTASIDELGSAWQALRAALVQPSTLAKMARSLRIMDGTLTRGVETAGGATRVVFHNPSIRDYLKEFLKNNSDLLLQIVESAVYFDQVAEASTVLRAIPAISAPRKTQLMDAMAGRALSLVENASQRETRIRSHLANLNELLRMADDHELSQLAEHVADEIELGLDIVSEAHEPDEAGEFVRAISSTVNPRLQNLADDVSEQVVREVTYDLSDWESCVWAESVLTAMGRADQGAHQYVEDQKHELAIREFEEALRSDTVPDARIYEYACEFHDPDEIFPGFELVHQHYAARVSVEPARRVYRDSSVEAGEIQLIGRMFSSLSAAIER